MSIKNKELFSVEVDGETLELAVKRPNAMQTRQAKMVYAKVFREFVEAGAYVRVALDDIMRKKGLWDDDKDQKVSDLVQILNDGQEKLRKGGIKKSEAQQIALNMASARMELRALSAQRDELDASTAEANADNASFDYLASVCIVYNDTGKPYFRDQEDYENRREEEAAYKGAFILAKMQYRIGDDYYKSLPENRFLIEQGFLTLDDSDGKTEEPSLPFLNDDELEPTKDE